MLLATIACQFASFRLQIQARLAVNRKEAIRVVGRGIDRATKMGKKKKYWTVDESVLVRLVLAFQPLFNWRVRGTGTGTTD